VWSAFVTWSLVVCLAVGNLDHIATIRIYDMVFIMTSVAPIVSAPGRCVL
jgi:hypothetical protein